MATASKTMHIFINKLNWGQLCLKKYFTEQF